MHLEQRVLVTGGAGFLGSHLCERLLATGANVICVDNFFSGTRSNIEHLLDHKRFELIRHDVTFPLYVEVDEIYNLACPASPDPLSARSGADDQDQRARRDQHARPGQAREGKNPAGVDLRGLRRSQRPSADRGLLGPRQSDRPALLLRRRQALRGNAVLRLSPPAQHADQGDADLQHLRPAHASERRARGVEFHRSGVARPRHHGLRRRRADALVLLRRRSDRRHDAADGDAGRASPGRSTSAIRPSSRSCNWRRRSSR